MGKKGKDQESHNWVIEVLKLLLNVCHITEVPQITQKSLMWSPTYTALTYVCTCKLWNSALVESLEQSHLREFCVT